MLALASLALGQAGLSITMLLTKSHRAPTDLPLLGLFAAWCVIVSSHLASVFLPNLRTHFIATTLPAYLSLGPSLWIYVEGLTSEVPWRWTRKHTHHLAGVGIGIIGAGALIALPPGVRETMLLEGVLPGGPMAALVALLVFGLVLLWIGQSFHYLIAIARRLTAYRRRLRDLFASNEHRELHWISALIVILGSVWILAIIAVIADNLTGRSLITPQMGVAMALACVWFLSVWGLRQESGFEGRYPPAQLDAAPGKKYQRSALGTEQARRIAAKLDAAMAQQQLYLDPNLSLHKLASQLAISPNYVSQTLNEVIGLTFFDYVNKWRIDDAKARIIQGDETVLSTAFAVGFNANSSFYKAFKHQTGQTPVAFRKAQEKT